MGALLGPIAGALLAALGAGVVLGLVRLHRLSLAWWRQRAARLAAALGPGAGAPARDGVAAPAAPTDGALADRAAAPPVFGALACVGLAAAVLVVVAWAPGAMRLEPVLRTVPSTGAPDLATLVALVSGLVGFALATLVATPALALVASALDVAIHLGVARLRRGSDALEEPRLAGRDLVATARRLLPGAEAAAPGEPFGVGLAYAFLFGAAALGVGGLLAAATADDSRAGAGMAALAALGLLATPVVYAAAADRSRDVLRARLRRDAAVRQLAVAPLWIAAAAVLVVLPAAPGAVRAAAALAFALAGTLALPGALAAPGALRLPRGGDCAEPAAVVRALSGIAHYAWIGVGAALPFVASRGPGAGGLAAAFGAGGVALVVFLVARALVPRAGVPTAIAAPAGEAHA